MNPGTVFSPTNKTAKKTSDAVAKPNTNTPKTVSTDTPELAETLFSWETSEYIEHQRNALWYVVLAVGTLLFAVFSVLVLKEWLGAVVVTLMSVAVLMYARREPKTLKCSLQGNGINIGERFYPYSMFRSFSLVSDGAMVSLEFDPLKRFMPLISVYIAPNDQNKVLDVLASRLPQGDREQDPIDKLARTLKI